MNSMIRLTSTALSLLGLSVAASVEAGEPRVDYSGQVMQGYCATDWPVHYEPKVYFSDIFEIRIPQGAGVNYPADLGKTYGAYLQQRYGYASPTNSPAMCALFENVQSARASKKLQQETARYNSTRARRPEDPVIETGWQASSDQAPAPKAASTPAAAAASAASVTLHGYCFTSSRPSFRSAVFSVAMPMAAGSDVDWVRQGAQVQWKQAYGLFLSKTYSNFLGIAQCGAFKTLAEAQAYQRSMTPAAPASAASNITETGWSYKASAN